MERNAAESVAGFPANRNQTGWIEPTMRKAVERFIQGSVIGLILAATLWPSPERPSESFAFCIACGSRGIADALLNVALFFPWGVIGAWSSRSFRRAVVTGFLLSVFVELAQTVIPGRDPSLSDVIFNSIGALLGAYTATTRKVWLAPREGRAVVLSLGALFIVVAVMTGTALALSPLDSLGSTATRIEAVAPRRFSPDNPVVIAYETVAASGSTLTVQQWGEDVGLTYPSWAGAHGFDEPAYWSRNALRNRTMPAKVELRLEKRSWRVSVDSSRTGFIGPTPGSGWALMLYPDAIGHRWGELLNSLWLLALCLPIGFWSRRRSILVAAAALACCLLLIPLIAGTAAASFQEWLGVALGLLLGGVLQRMTDKLDRRRFSESKAGV